VPGMLQGRLAWETIMAKHTTQYSLAEEIWHAVSHGIGILLSIAGLTILVAFSARNGDAWHVTSTAIYGATLIMMYTASTVYHGVTSARAKAILRHVDHATIYLLIAGTYTPFLLNNLRQDWGWSLFGIIWTLALAGVVFELTGYKPLKRISLWLYLAMGWMIVFAVKPMIENVSTGGLVLLLAGGLAYTFGALFYVRKSMPYHHVIWHLFVLAGSILHFFSILFYVVP